jgi:hypothetical protein
MQEKMYTYSEDFFMIAFFTLRARGVSTTVLVAGGGVTPASGTVPATAMVTVSVEVVDGSVSTSWRLGSGREADGLQKVSVSMQKYRYMKTQQGSIFIPGGLDYMRFPLAHYPTTLRDQRQSFGQLHGWCGRTNLLELFQLKSTSHHDMGDTNSTHFKRNNPLVCWVTARFNHGYTGSR